MCIFTNIAAVCKWLGFYLCLRESPKFIKDSHTGELHMYDAIIVWKGSKIGGQNFSYYSR